MKVQFKPIPSRGMVGNKAHITRWIFRAGGNRYVDFDAVWSSHYDVVDNRVILKMQSNQFQFN